jgi:hypothetical protein
MPENLDERTPAEKQDDATYSTETRDSKPDVWTARIRIEDEHSNDAAEMDIRVGRISFLISAFRGETKKVATG